MPFPVRINAGQLSEGAKMEPDRELLPTRKTLLTRLKNWDDDESWRDFFETYWRLIYHTAIRSGLSNAEAQDVVQETVVSVLKSIKEYDAQNGSFKGWLMRLTKWRITDQLRKRQKKIKQPTPQGTSTKTGTIERVVDPASLTLEATWDEEWETNLLKVAVERVKRKVNPNDYQIFDLYAVKQWPVARVTSALKVNRARIYLVKHRIGNLVKKEITYLKTKPV